METRKLDKSTSLVNTLASSQASTGAATSKATDGAKQIATVAGMGAGTGNAIEQSRKDPSGINVNISARSKELADARKKALDVARATPAVREDRVAELKAKINDGTYQVDSGKVADGIMREAIMDHLSDTRER